MRYFLLLFLAGPAMAQNPELLIQTFGPACTRAGFTPNTEPWVRCIIAAVETPQAAPQAPSFGEGVSRGLRGAGRTLQGAGQNQTQTQTRCYTMGSSVYCDTY
jgi:hypothetical protein